MHQLQQEEVDATSGLR